MQARLRLCLGGLSLLSSLLVADAASATHHAWQLYDQGSACASYDGNANVPRVGVVVAAPTGAWVSCPVNLSGQFNGVVTGTNSQAIYAHATVPVSGAEVDVSDLSTAGSVTCLAYGTSETGAYYYSRSKSTDYAGTGTSTLQIAPAGQQWGGTLGAGTDNVAIRSLIYTCWLPGNYSYVIAYRTSVCVNNSTCE